MTALPPDASALLDVVSGDPLALLHLVCDLMAEAVVVADASGKVVMLGAATRRLIGLPDDAPPPADWSTIAGRYLADGVTPVPVDRLLVTRALRGESVAGEIFCFRPADQGTGILVDGRARPILGQDGSIRGCVVVWRDIGTQDRSRIEMQGWLAKIAATVHGVICSFRQRPDGRVSMPYATAALVDLYGLQPEQVRDDATPLLARIHPDDIDRIRASIDASAATLGPWRAEFRVNHPQRGEIWIGGHSMPERESDGSILWHGFIEDICERKRMEAALRDSERLYRAIGESIDYGVWVCAPDGRNIYASESFLRLVGLTQEQCSDFGWGEVLHPDDAERTIAAWKECSRSGNRHWDIEHRFRGVDGRWHDVLARGVPVRNERGEITHWAGINLDISRLKQVEQSLREREADLQRAQAVARTGSWRVDVVRDETYWSDETYRIFGIDKGTPISYRTYLTRVHPDDRERVERSWRTALPGTTYDIEHRIVVDGAIRWVHERVELEFDDRGGLRGGLGTTQEITERKQAEAALATSESRFRLAMEAVTSVVYDWDRSSDSIYWSSGLSRKFGVDSDDPGECRRWWRDSVHPDDRRRLRAEIRRCLRAGEEQMQAEYRMRHRQGHWIPIADRARLVRDDRGRPVRIVGSLTDISDRQRAEEALRRINDTLEEQVAQRTAEVEARSSALAESERFARATIDALDTSLCVIDAGGRIIAVNRAWREFALANGGIPGQLAEGTNYLAVCDAAARDGSAAAAEMARAIRAAANGRHQDFALEYDCHSADARRWFITRLTSFPGEGPLRLVVTHENITERKLAAENLEVSARRLKRLAAHLETVREEQSAKLAREVHDELGGTLTMLKLGLATMAEGLDAGAPPPERVRHMLDQVDAALQTVKRISAGLRPAMLDTLGLIATLRWHANEFSRLTGIATELRLPAFVALSRERSTAVFRIVQEALTNVARHAGARRVTVLMQQRKGHLVVDIDDDGIGVSNASLGKPDSFGILGMHERAQFLGGRLTIGGRASRGTRLRLCIPSDDPSPGPA